MKTLQDYIKLAESATEGPWLRNPKAAGCIQSGERNICVTTGYGDNINPEKAYTDNIGNGDFIAASRTLGPAMAKALIEAESFMQTEFAALRYIRDALLADDPDIDRAMMHVSCQMERLDKVLSTIQNLNGGKE